MAGTQKGAEREGRVIVWVDESGFYLLPALVGHMLLGERRRSCGSA